MSAYIVAALILGPIGALAGLLGAGHSSEMQVLVTMRGGVARQTTNHLDNKPICGYKPTYE